MSRAFKMPKATVPTKVASPSRPDNVNRDTLSVSRAPRLTPLKTRIYAKGIAPGADPAQIAPANFGQTGLTGES